MQRDRFDAIVRAAGVEPPGSSRIGFEGDEQVFQSPMHLAEGSAALLGLVGASVDEIWATRTGRRQDVTIDQAHAAVALSSMWVLRVDGELAVQRLLDAPGPGGQGVYRCADGREIYLLSGFPHLAQATLNELGCDPTAEAVAAACAGRSAFELEEAFVARQLTPVTIRTHDEWLAHPQGSALRNQTAVHIERIGDAPPTPLPQGDRPLSGLRVLDATRVLAGPTCTRTLAEFGADVLHVGSPHIPDLAAAQADTGHGKLRAHLDLAVPDEAERMRELLSDADVFCQSYRAGSLDRRGFGPRDAARLRPGIIYVSENAYGREGPWREKRGFDGNVQAASGIHALHVGLKSPDGPAMAMNDYGTGYWGAYGVLQALLRRAREGGSWHVQISLAQTARWFMRLGTDLDPAQGLDAGDIYALVRRHSESHASPYGRLERLQPVVGLSDTPAHWERPTVMPGTDLAAWPAR